MNTQTILIVIVSIAFVGILGTVLVRAFTIPAAEDRKLDSMSVERLHTAYVAGGCFWCVEADLEKQEGVTEAVSGFMGGSEVNPKYKDVAAGKTGHRESVKVLYDPTKISFGEIVRVTLIHTDPTDEGGTFYDRGHQYTTAIYYETEEEKQIAEKIIKELDASGIFEDPVVTPVEKAGTFYPAEEGHQDYYQKNPLRYSYYRTGSGRDAFIKETKSRMQENNKETVFDGNWREFSMPSEEELKAELTDLQYKVTQHEGTERPFDNEYNENKQEGIYVDIVSGEPLFSSTHKYDSGTGWPSFTQPINAEQIVEKEDKKLFTTRTEVRSKLADSHLGHVFNDGPKDSTGLRYCINSAALHFIPKEDLEKEGYGEFLSLFN